MSSNRFRRAIPNGHQRENVTDIKTAGISKVEEEPIVADIEQLMPLKSKDANISNVDVSIPKQAEVSNYIDDHMAKILSDKDANIELFSSQIQEEKPQPTVSQGALPVTQPRYPEYDAAYSESVSAKPVKNGKNNVPNMFTHKNESKSIRKSLVLRPSSVKIAENYCAENGGSFNELIQILLDNFIDEYGL